MEKEYIKLTEDAIEDLCGKVIMFKEPLCYEDGEAYEQDYANTLLDERDPMFFYRDGKRFIKPNYPVFADWGIYSGWIELNGWGYIPSHVPSDKVIEVEVVEFTKLADEVLDKLPGKKIIFKEPFLYGSEEEMAGLELDPMFVVKGGKVYIRPNYPISVSAGRNGWPELNGWDCVFAGCEDDEIAIVGEAEEPKPIRYCVVWADQDGVFRVIEAESKEAAVKMLEKAHEDAVDDKDFVDYEDLDPTHTRSYVAYKDDTFVRTQVIDMD